MPSKTSLLKLLLVGASCAVIAACSDSSISSPGEQNQVPPPTNGGGDNTAVNLLPAGGCATGTQSHVFSIAGRSVTACRITGEVTSDLTLTADGVYFLSGPVFVGADLGADVANPLASGSRGTLNIPAGATIAGSTGSDYLVVSRGSQINALGTASDPIVFTSSADVIATATNAPRTGASTNRGEWGGIVLNGRAPINKCIDGAAVGGSIDCEKQGEGSSGLFGGDNVGDNSGTLQYVQVRYAGYAVNDENELNGIAFQGVGNGTTVDHIQVHNNADDGIEFFGGSVNAKYLVLTGNRDDNVDYTDGYTGSLQFIIVTQRGDAGTSDPRGFEMDSNSTAGSLPYSDPNIANFTLVGAPESEHSDEGILLRRGTRGEFINGIVVDFNKSCLDVDGDETAGFIGTTLNMRSVFIDCAKLFETDDNYAETLFNFPGSGNVSGTNTMEGLFPGATEQAVAAVNPTTLGSFFTATDYIGAFAPTESVNNNWAANWTFGVLPDTGCPSGTVDVNATLNGERVCQLRGNITQNVRLSRGNVYELSGPVFVGVDMGGDPANPLADGVAATLTVDAGVTVYGASGGDYLVVARGSKLRSNGTAASPVVFTARQDLAGSVDDTSRGFWGGIVLNGRAPINKCIAAVPGGSVGCQSNGEGSSGQFGGATVDDDSGVLTYTRVQFAGFAINNEDELNGIAFQGVGNGTLVDYVQVHNNFDDGVEFFGGTVNAKHIVLTGNRDDNLDYTDGYVGNVQYVIVQQNGDAGSDDPRGFEMDNRSSNNDQTPRSNPNVVNFTLVGVNDGNNAVTSQFSHEGILLRRGTAGTFANGLVVDFDKGCLDVDDAATLAQFTADELNLRSVHIDCEIPFITDDAYAATVFNEAGNGNTQYTTTLNGYSFIDAANTPNNTSTGIVPGANETALNATAVDPSTINAFFDAATYVGAIEDANDTWYLGWTYRQQ